MTPATRIFDILTNYKAQYSKPVMVAGKAAGTWTNYSTDTFVSLVNNLSKGLVAKGIQKDDKIALMSANRPEWNFCDFAINQLGAAVVPLYPTLSSQDLSFIIDDASVKLIFISNTELHEKIKDALQTNGLDIPIYSFDTVEGIPSWRQLVDDGAELDTDLTP